MPVVCVIFKKKNTINNKNKNQKHGIIKNKKPKSLSVL
jgi:hypothetical protein